jgi:predicted NAD/FAD-dependent oxidoreductase
VVSGDEWPRVVSELRLFRLLRIDHGTQLTVYLGIRATHLAFTDRVWAVQTDQGTIHTAADVVLSAIPAPQFLELG